MSTSLTRADPLEALLHRCHRDELLPLAKLVGVNERGMGLGDLARAVATAIGQAGSHQLANVTRGGKGRPYHEILADVAKQRGVELGWPPDLEKGEIGVLRSWFAERWDQLDGAEKERLWKELGIDGVAPATGEKAVWAAQEALGRSFGYAAGLVTRTFSSPAALTTAGMFLAGPTGCVVRPLLAPLTPILAWYYLRPDAQLVLAAILEVARLRQAVLHRVTIGVVGSPSTGKDAAIKALFGIDTGNISPVAGSTKEVSIQKLPGATALFVVNTPGMGDVVENVTEAARQVLDHIDVYLYLVNAEGGVQARELADYQRCRATGKPVLALVNKVDVLRPRDKDRYLADARAKLGAPEDAFLPVAFDPLPQLSSGPIGTDLVRDWLVKQLGALGKDTTELPALPEPAPVQA